MQAHAFHPSAQKAESGWLQGAACLQNETLPQKIKHSILGQTRVCGALA